MGKVSFVVGAAVGYVLGAHAGRKRYDQIKGGATKLWHSGPVQHRVGDATQAVKEQAAPYVTEKLGEAVKAVGVSMRNSSHGHQQHVPESLHKGTDGHYHPDTTGYGPGADKLP